MEKNIDGCLKQKGRIFDIQRYSIHDGPGIRTIVFLKGCFFRCRWCCNPESQNYGFETMNVQGKPKAVGEDVTVEHVMDIVKKDAAYYYKSGGGITLSGGESLFQPEFARALLMEAKSHGFTTAMESTGFAPYETIESILPYLDTFLMDIKHINPIKHKEFIGKSNELVLENARKIAVNGMTNLIIRVPVIPTFNDSPEEISEISKFAGSLPGVKKIHLLPYHRLGQDKYEGLGREYSLKDIEPPVREHMEMLKKAVENTSNLECHIGG